ncbi:MAG TPA: ABC transporter permease [Phycisphaerales bacterium]|nr:ABC transporter permease [Phycisphaerales bacterium]
MRQTLAIFLDAYRELNSKKLFWIVMSISLAIVIALALPSNNDRGVSFFGMTLELPFLSTRAVSPKGFYVQLFSSVGVGLWLTWGAAILALISTAGVIPDFISGGVVDLQLAKPIGRLRLFLTRYLSALLFVGLQATVFVAGMFLVIGLRGGAWRPGVLLAIPIVLVFFSYLFCICVLIGMVTRSTLMALLGTALIWLFIWAIGTTEQVFLDQTVASQRQVQSMRGQVSSLENSIVAVETQIRALRAARREQPTPDESESGPAQSPGPSGADPAQPPPTKDPAPPAAPPRSNRPGAEARKIRNLISAGQALMSGVGRVNDIEALERGRNDMDRQKESLETELVAVQASLDSTRKWHRWIYLAKAALPKTTETTALFDRYVIDPADREGMFAIIEQSRMTDGHEKDTDEALRGRSLWWVLGTSLGFEAVVLGIAAGVFCRRDF